jgi:hypothetical protein
MKCWVCDDQESVGKFSSIGFSENELKKLTKKNFSLFKKSVRLIAGEKIGMIELCLKCARKLEYDMNGFEWASEWREFEFRFVL